VYAEDALIAVLVQLSELHLEDVGRWYVEAVFGVRVNPSGTPLFATAGNARARRRAPAANSREATGRSTLPV
jgi:hypothetical protein